MDNQEIETSIADQKKNPMNKTQNTFLSTSSSRKFRINTKYRLSSSQNGNQFLPPISTSNSDFNFHSINQKSNIYNQSKYGLFRKNYDSNNLKQRLSENKMDMNKTNNELTELKKSLVSGSAPAATTILQGYNDEDIKTLDETLSSQVKGLTEQIISLANQIKLL